jgi:hypothetical protein
MIGQSTTEQGTKRAREEENDRNSNHGGDRGTWQSGRASYRGVGGSSWHLTGL